MLAVDEVGGEGSTICVGTQTCIATQVTVFKKL
jgi:hypothetical protein